jgi:hypothetical protein
MSQIPAQLVSKSANLPNNPSIDTQYPAAFNTANANNPTESTAVSITALSDQQVLRPTAPRS